MASPGYTAVPVSEIAPSLYPPKPPSSGGGTIAGARSQRRLVLATVLGFFLAFLVLIKLKPNVGASFRDCPKVEEAVDAWKPGSRSEKVQSLYRMGKYENRSWLEHILGLDEDGLAPITHFAQQYLYDNQNPPIESCAEAQYYLLDLQGLNDEMHGLGSLVHILSFSMLNAIETHRILMWDPLHPFGRAFADQDCRADGLHSMDCVFVPLSHCSHTFMNDENTIRGYKMDPPEGYEKFWTGHTPTVFQEELLRRLPYEMTANSRKYWWRAQTAAYFLRPNPASLAQIRATRMDPSVHYAFTLHNSPDGLAQEIPMPFPLPRGTQSFHIRHGDKGFEMELQSLEDFIETGKELSKMNPLAYGKNVFLSSEDPGVFEEAKKILRLDDTETVGSQDWVWYSSKINRFNGGPFTQLGQFGNRTETTLSWMSELMLAMECDAFVGTRGSNWNRVIDELRCIWIDKCSHPYYEVGPEKDWGGYQW